MNKISFAEWHIYFQKNQRHFSSISFFAEDILSEEEKSLITSSLQQFQKGEHSEGKHLYAFAKKMPYDDYLNCIRLFIKEEQRHAKVLKLFMFKHNIPPISSHWIDTVFRFLRKLAGIENTVRVLLVAEIIASVYYQALHNATKSSLLRQLCQQILKDEDQHIRFQCRALQLLTIRKPRWKQIFNNITQWILMHGTICIVWWHHRQVLQKGGYSFLRFFSSNRTAYFEAVQLIHPKKKSLNVHRRQPVSIH